MIKEKDLELIFTPKRVREQSERIFELAIQQKTHFNIHLDQMDKCAQFVVETINQNYPDLNIPFHSRWGHFKVGGVDRISFLNKKLEPLPIRDRVRAKLDLAIVSVLLDAGAGMEWSYNDVNAKKYSKSEGLAVASFNLFLQGFFSSDKKNNLRVDAEKLISIKPSDIALGFQASKNNPLVGTEGRSQVLQRLGSALNNNKPYFPGKDSRPGNLIDHLISVSDNNKIHAEQILKALLFGLNEIWPARIQISGQNLGDVWNYTNISISPSFESLVPFHKLSQWMTYSLIEPIEEMGLQVTHLNDLTGLPEYRNGGLFYDMGVLSLRHQADLEKVHTPESAFIIEWRALTVVLLDKIAELVRKKLNKNEDEFPLIKILEGGTWWAGRRIAKEKRRDGGAPFKIQSDGTVF